MNLSQVSRTAILTLIARVVASEKENAVFNDPMAVLCLERLISVASAEEKNWIIGRKRFYGGISAHDAIAGARRARIFDDIANRYIAANPRCTVINLACGFDTRFWRIANENCRYIEIDLPEVVTLKREILKDQLGYELIGCSVLDASWIDRVIANGSSRFLLLAEGLLMFLPKPDVTQLFQRLAQRFTHSQFAFDMVPEKYLKGLWKVLLRLETRINWRLDASWISGIKDPGEIESYGPGLKVLGAIKGSAGPIITVSINAAFYEVALVKPLVERRVEPTDPCGSPIRTLSERRRATCLPLCRSFASPRLATIQASDALRPKLPSIRADAQASHLILRSPRTTDHLPGERLHLTGGSLRKPGGYSGTLTQLQNERQAQAGHQDQARLGFSCAPVGISPVSK